MCYAILAVVTSFFALAVAFSIGGVLGQALVKEKRGPKTVIIRVSEDTDDEELEAILSTMNSRGSQEDS